MLTQADKAAAFAELHERPRTFIIPNPWDVGSARLLEHLGFEALATSSAGYAFSVGMADNAVRTAACGTGSATRLGRDRGPARALTYAPVRTNVPRPAGAGTLANG